MKNVTVFRWLDRERKTRCRGQVGADTQRIAKQGANGLHDKLAVNHRPVGSVVAEDRVGKIQDRAMADAAVEAGRLKLVWRMLVAAETIPGPVEIRIVNLPERFAFVDPDAVRALIHDLLGARK